MVEQGQALAVLSNHEFNALAWAATDPDDQTSHLWPHSAKNHHEHTAFLAGVATHAALHQDVLARFRTLSVFLELPGLRVIHACWHAQQLQLLAHWLTDTDDDRRQRIALFRYGVIAELVQWPEDTNGVKRSNHLSRLGQLAHEERPARVAVVIKVYGGRCGMQSWTR
jgi:hypothetical protein